MKFEGRHMTWAWLAAAVLFFVFGTQTAIAQTATIGTIVGSKHDFSATGTSDFAGTTTQVCVYCHAPHASTTSTPLWNHTVSGVTSYDMYSSPTLNADMAGVQPGNTSKLCLSCHDGTVAIDSFGGNTAPTGVKFSLNSSKNLGGVGGKDLTNDHPIGFAYNATLVGKDPGLADPVAKSVTIGTANTGTIATKMLIAGQMECASCHDVHNSTAGTAQADKLLRITSAGSALCLACHNK